MDPVIGAIVGAGLAFLGSVIATRSASKAKKVDESVAITKLQMDTWQAILAERDKTIERLEARLAALAEPERTIAEHEAVIATVTKQNEAMHAELMDLRRGRRAKEQKP